MFTCKSTDRHQMIATSKRTSMTFRTLSIWHRVKTYLLFCLFVFRRVFDLICQFYWTQTCPVGIGTNGTHRSHARCPPPPPTPKTRPDQHTGNSTPRPTLCQLDIDPVYGNESLEMGLVNMGMNTKTSPLPTQLTFMYGLLAAPGMPSAKGDKILFKSLSSTIYLSF